MQFSLIVLLACPVSIVTSSSPTLAPSSYAPPPTPRTSAPTYRPTPAPTYRPTPAPTKDLSSTPAMIGLSALYFSTQGSDWASNTNWMKRTGPCDPNYQWYGVTCHSPSDDQQYYYGAVNPFEEDEILELNLAANNLYGTLPSEIGLLTSVTRSLFLQDNSDLKGTLPSEVGNFGYLRLDLSIGNTKISGPIPSQLGLLSNLKETLLLGTNRLTGLIPSELGLLTSRVLYGVGTTLDIDLTFNSLCGDVPPEVAALSSTATVPNIYPGNNLLGTPCPTPAPTSQPSTTPAPTLPPTPVPTLQPSSTQVPTLPPSPGPSLWPSAPPTQVPTLLPSPVPTSFPTAVPTSHPSSQPTPLPTSHPSYLPSPAPTKDLFTTPAMIGLSALYFSTQGSDWASNANWMKRTGPCEDSDHPWTRVSCESNEVSGLQMVSNNLNGTLPSEIGLLTSLLNAFDFQGNSDLKGTLPSELGNFGALDYGLMISNTDVSGPIPSELGLLTNLQVHLQLGTNRLTGPIPSELGLLTNYPISLDLSFNSLCGDVPPEFLALPSSAQVVIDVQGNFLGLPCPTNPPSPLPSPFPTSSPFPIPTLQPTSYPTAVPTLLPSTSQVPTLPPSPVPTLQPSSTQVPTLSPSPVPTLQPSITPAPTLAPSPLPTLQPTPVPTSTVYIVTATASAVMNGINSVSDLTKERQEAWGAALAASIPLVWSSGGSVNVTGAELLEVGPTPNNTIARRRSLLRHSEKEKQGHTGTAAIAAADDTEEEESTAVVTEDADGIWRKEQRKERVGELNGSGPVQQTAVASQQRLGRQLLSSVSLLVHYTLVISAPDSSATDLVNTIQRELNEAFNSSAFTTNLLFPNGLNSSQPTSLWDGVTLNLDATLAEVKDGVNYVVAIKVIVVTSPAPTSLPPPSSSTTLAPSPLKTPTTGSGDGRGADSAATSAMVGLAAAAVLLLCCVVAGGAYAFRQSNVTLKFDQQGKWNTNDDDGVQMSSGANASLNGTNPMFLHKSSSQLTLDRRPLSANDDDDSSSMHVPGPTGDGLVYEIPRHALILEDKPFARGGGGQIFRGRYRVSQIAAKQVFSAMDNKENVEEFNREVGMLVKLRHPNVLSCFGVSNDPDGSMYQILEFCSGGDLQGYYVDLDFTVPEFGRILLELFGALVYLHERQIAHRDLKPENVLLSDPKTRKVKLADFGLAKTNRQTVTRGVGTPSYMSPELFDDDDDPEKFNMLKVDIYALGIILAQLWTKRPPWKGKSPHKVMSLALKGKRPPLEGFKDSDVHSPPPPPAALKALIEHCWQQLPNDRPDAEEVFRVFQSDVAPSITLLEGSEVDRKRSATTVSPPDFLRSDSAMSTGDSTMGDLAIGDFSIGSTTTGVGAGGDDEGVNEPLSSSTNSTVESSSTPAAGDGGSSSGNLSVESTPVKGEWYPIEDPSSGKTYYVNSATNEVSWTLPSTSTATFSDL